MHDDDGTTTWKNKNNRKHYCIGFFSGRYNGAVVLYAPLLVDMAAKVFCRLDTAAFAICTISIRKEKNGGHD
jgi:hypothetical protein